MFSAVETIGGVSTAEPLDRFGKLGVVDPVWNMKLDLCRLLGGMCGPYEGFGAAFGTPAG